MLSVVSSQSPSWHGALQVGDVLAYLRARGLISDGSAVDGWLKVVPASRRNNNFIVEVSSGKSYFLKEGVGSHAQYISHEERVYRTLLGDPLIRRHVPDVRAYDSDRSLLLLELIPRAATFRSLYQHRFPRSAAAAVGRLLGVLHSRNKAVPEEMPDMGSPSVLSAHRPSVEDYIEMTGGQVGVVHIVQSQRDLCEGLDRLRAEWIPSHFTHHDVRWDNLLVADRRVFLIDWELARLGDPAWDVACFLGEYVSCWVSSLPPGTGSLPSSAGAAMSPLGTMHKAVQAFWDSYDQPGTTTGDRVPYLAHVMRLAAARLVQRALELAASDPEIRWETAMLIQVSSNIMARPYEASVQLLGLV